MTMTIFSENWQQFLTAQGATFSHGELTGFNGTAPNNLDITSSTYVSPLTQRALLTCAGPEAFKFLQGQVTCNVDDLHQPQARLGAHCTHKGRMIASFVAFATHSDTIALSVNSGCLDALKTALGKYIVFSKAKLAVADNQVGVGIAGSNAETVLKTLFGDVPDSIYATVTSNSGTVIRIAQQQFECWLSEEVAMEVWSKMQPECQAIGNNDWDRLCIQQGLAEVRAQTIEEFIPQMLNFEPRDGISYSKGCYTGQEVVARMTYLGKLKRHTYRMELAGTQQLLPGTPVYAAQSTQSAGHIVMSATTHCGNTACLVCVTDQAVSDNGVFLDQAGEQKFEILPLPYAITKAE